MKLEGAGACQCGAPLAPLIEELSRRRLRGRRGVESAIWEKKERSIENHCHSETSDRCHWSWESVSFPDSSMFLCGIKENGLPRRFAQRDGGIPRFIDLPPSPFRGNDRLVLDMCVDLYVSARCNIAGRHSGRPLRARFWCTLSFLSCSCRYSGDPFGADAPLPLRGAALRGKDSGFCADLGSASRQRFRTGAWRRGAPLAPLIGELARRQP